MPKYFARGKGYKNISSKPKVTLITLLFLWLDTGQQWTYAKMQISPAETKVKTQGLFSHITD